ncbi:MAG TPA: TAT-variant-translocated molybdopterin oxidoreductase [Bacteroidota bacterium]|nr:TAT-variant-translocated molybdopterin oxidoreductase [Bacteroidota bacterium]
MSEKNRFDIASIRARLSGEKGSEYWKSLDELAETEEFNEFLHREFPREASVWDDALSRRGFLKIMGASLALAGLSGCVKQPEEKIVPYVKQPEILVPGKPLSFATAFIMGGYATGVLATSHMGRPTRIEGNPDHPASLGATDVFATASILSLYDPDRSQVVTNKRAISTWDKFFAQLQTAIEVQRALKGSGLRILTETVTSPTLAHQMNTLLTQFPNARWHQYEPLHEDNAFEGAKLVFGMPLQTRHRFDRADIVVSLDSDFIAQGPGHIRSARDFANRRRVQGSHAEMNRLYVAECMPSVTGSMADHRLRAPSSHIENIARGLAAGLHVEGVHAAQIGEPEQRWVDAALKDLLAHRGKSIVVAGPQQSPIVHAAVHAMNNALGNTGETVLYTDPVEASPMNHGDSLQSLLHDLDSGEVDLLIMLGANPSYSAPADLKINEKLGKARLSVHLGAYNDETADACDWHIPQSHYLEAWSDARAFDGTATIMQPLIAPLYNSKSAHELIGGILDDSGRKSHEIVQDFWKTQRGGGHGFENFWKTSLNNGVVEGTSFPVKQPALRQPSDGWKFSSPAGDGLEISFRPDSTIFDGRFANNGWLQECPKPVTKLTWDNAAFISPATAQRYHLESNDLVELAANGRTVKAPVCIQPGHADSAVTLHLGYGRKKAGHLGTGIGANANLLRTAGSQWHAAGAEMRKTGESYTLAITQDHHSMEGRAIVRAANVEEFEKEPSFAKEMSEVPTASQSLYPPKEYPGYAWGMTIDLNACTGCNACVVACQSENNIPIVGKDQVSRGREMQWIRVDRYYKNDLDDPEIYNQPVACQHCENAPCELVCPVAATTHDSEGLNVMTYNRCVGTRYCSNNCPYKVRRFNFLQYSDVDTETLKMMYNPDVTVRNRGVMEKCTFCVQRISHARIEAKKEDREIRDGEVTTACQSACPAQAIVFGNINDATSNVAQRKADPRNYALLSELNTKPRLSYLAKLSNPNPALEKPEKPG